MALPHSLRIEQCEFLHINEYDLQTTQLHSRVVSLPTKLAICSNQHHFGTSCPKEHIDSTTLLSNLNRMAPAVAKDFVPRDLAESNLTFRLINNIDYKGEDNGYIAMSYCSKKVSRCTPRRVITPIGDLPFGWTKEVEQFPLPTSGSLFQAVLQERREGEGLWFDQVCINQDDEAERTRTIGVIDTIFKNARTIVVVLDDIVVQPDEETFLRYYLEQYSYSTPSLERQMYTQPASPFIHNHPALISLLERMLGSSWFTRSWCAHEMKMGQSHTFLLPCYSKYEDCTQTIVRFTGNFFLHMLSLVSDFMAISPEYHPMIRTLSTFFHSLENPAGRTGVAVCRPDTPQADIAFQAPFVPIIVETFRLQAGGNPRLPEYLRRLDANRDKMIIALSASRLPIAMTATNPFSRPKIEAECLRSLLLVSLAAQDPVALCTTGAPLQLHDGSISWLCQPTALDVNVNDPGPRRFSATANPIIQSSDGRAEFAQLDLIFLDLPHRLQPNPKFSTQVVKARVLIDLCIQYQVDGSAVWNFWQEPGHSRAPSMRNSYIQTLACVFECGLQWIIDVSSHLRQPNAPAIEAHELDLLLNPQLIIQNYIVLPEGATAMTKLLTFLSTIISSGIPWGSGASECSHGPLIVAAPSSTPDDDISSPYDTHTGRAITYAPFEHSKTLLVSVPSAVKDINYSNLARGWNLTSMNPFTGSPKPTVSWTLQSKAVMFGDRQFNYGLSACSEAHVRNHRVYGPSTLVH